MVVYKLFHTSGILAVKHSLLIFRVKKLIFLRLCLLLKFETGTSRF